MCNKIVLKNLTWCVMPWNILQHIGQLHIQGTKTLSPSFCCFYNTLHTSLLTCPFFLSVVFFQENVFHQVVTHFCLWNDGLEISWHSLWCTSSTLNLKWSILVCPEFARHITIQFRTVTLSNLLNSFMYHLVIFFLSKR